MNLKEAVTSVFTKYATFNGRARRSEYWYFVLFNFVVSAVLGVLANAIGVASTLSNLYSLAVLIPGLAVAWRRLHDIGKPGYCYFIFLIPIVGWILFLVWMCKDSQPGDNKYGPNPKSVYDGFTATAGGTYTAPEGSYTVSDEVEDEFAKAMKAFEDSKK